MIKATAIIPVHGRLPLLKVTIQRLWQKNNINHIICIGDTEEEKNLCTSEGCEFGFFDNKPLGRKWNQGFLRAKTRRPEAILYVGSSDWVSDNWLPVLSEFVNKYDIIGKTDFNMLHINDSLNLAHWPSYPSGSGREYEPIGIGRLLNQDFLDKIHWQPFDDYLNIGMDYSMYKKLQDVGGSCFLFNSIEIQSLAVSCDLWSNMHLKDFKLGVIPFYQPESWLSMWFPEALNLKI